MLTLDELIEKLTNLRKGVEGDVPVFAVDEDGRSYEADSVEFNNDDGPAVLINLGQQS